MLKKRPDHLDPASHPWLATPAVLKLFALIASAGGELRIVGGAVRDALLGRPVNDIDFAVNLPPEQVKEILEIEGIKVVPTGIAHGTLTAVLDHKGYEITSLRHDIETDGRHAKVTFTDDWQADAARRDFTMNALYLDVNHQLYDYFDAQADIDVRLIRFIGDPHARIEEDHLRILRAFRFYAQIGTPDFPAEIEAHSLNACFEMAHLLPSLSVERVWRELSRLLRAPNPVFAFELMEQGGVLPYLLPEATRIERLRKLVELEGKDTPICPLRRLASVVRRHADSVAVRLHMSNAEKAKLTCLEAAMGTWGILDCEKAIREKLYEYGPEIVRDAILLIRAKEPGVPMFSDYEKLIEQWEKPAFPLNGKDLMVLGIKEGVQIGRVMAGVEGWWREQGFTPNREACLVKARELLQGDV